LLRRGDFIEPSSGQVLREKIQAKSVPVETFFASCFEFAEGAKVPTWVFFPAWEWWCRKVGQWGELDRICLPQLLSRQLGEWVSGWTGDLAPRPHGAAREYFGIRLRCEPELVKHLKRVATAR